MKDRSLVHGGASGSRKLPRFLIVISCINIVIFVNKPMFSR